MELSVTKDTNTRIKQMGQLGQRKHAQNTGKKNTTLTFHGESRATTDQGRAGETRKPDGAVRTKFPGGT